MSSTSRKSWPTSAGSCAKSRPHAWMKSASKRSARQTTRHRAKPKNRLRPGCSDRLKKNPASAGFFVLAVAESLSQRARAQWFRHANNREADRSAASAACKSAQASIGRAAPRLKIFENRAIRTMVALAVFDQVLQGVAQLTSSRIFWFSSSMC